MDGKPVDIQNGIDTKYTDTTGTEVKTYDIKCAQLQFDSNGQLIDNTVNGSKTVPQYIKTEKLGEDGAKVLDGSCDGEQVIDFNFTGLTQYASPFSVAKLDQDGSTVGQLTGVEIASDGLVTASYSNSQTTTLGKIAMATFQNQQGLTQIGDTCWKQSVASGEAVPSQAGVGICGKIESSALEDSNTNLSNELVELIEAQRNHEHHTADPVKNPAPENRQVPACLPEFRRRPFPGGRLRLPFLSRGHRRQSAIHLARRLLILSAAVSA